MSSWNQAKETTDNLKSFRHIACFMFQTGSYVLWHTCNKLWSLGLINMPLAFNSMFSNFFYEWPQLCAVIQQHTCYGRLFEFWHWILFKYFNTGFSNYQKIQTAIPLAQLDKTASAHYLQSDIYISSVVLRNSDTSAALLSSSTSSSFSSASFW